ncbi:HNH endonuclease signature motif containing protein [Salipiger sp.]|uniref:HNH endonuclease signature motif containing protein n=1 Tax=Salipiger sp. TaxID=2078585 RepID=UPI003A980F63
MSKPPRLCACGHVVPHGERCRCQVAATRARNKRHDATRPTARQRGYDGAWQKARAAFLAAHPHCAHPGCNALATVVDHIVPHRGDKALFWDRTNWQPLCGHHHNAHKQRQERGQ